LNSPLVVEHQKDFLLKGFDDDDRPTTKQTSHERQKAHRSLQFSRPISNAISRFRDLKVHILALVKPYHVVAGRKEIQEILLTSPEHGKAGSSEARTIPNTNIRAALTHL
jgi:hypothetical protein